MKFHKLIIIGAGILVGAIQSFAADAASAARLVTIDYNQVLGGYSNLVDFNKRIEVEVQKVREAINLKSFAREALVKQANEIAAEKVDDETAASEQAKKLEPLVAAIQATEREIRDLQASPEIMREINETTGVFRDKIREAVDAELVKHGADLALDISTVNAIGLFVSQRSSGAKVNDITAAVIARLNTEASATAGK